MKKITILSTLLLCSLSLIACSHSEKTNEVKTEASSSVQETSSQEPSSSQKQTEETQVVGSDDYGYVKIPKSWVHGYSSKKLKVEITFSTVMERMSIL